MKSMASETKGNAVHILSLVLLSWFFAGWSKCKGEKKKGHTQKKTLKTERKRKKEQETGELRLDGKDNPDHQEPENGERGEEKKKICPLHARTDGGQWKTGVMCRKIRNVPHPLQRTKQKERWIDSDKERKRDSPIPHRSASLIIDKATRNFFFFLNENLPLPPPLFTTKYQQEMGIDIYFFKRGDLFISLLLYLPR